MSAGLEKLPVVVTAKVKLNELVTRFEFAHADGKPLPPFSGGAHTVVEMRDGGVTRLNPYSLMSDPMDPTQYAISVRRDDAGRGGSVFLHDKVRVGDRLVLGYPVNLFALDLTARKHLMIAGGIGITPFVAQIKQLQTTGGAFELHYSARSHALASYADELRAAHPARINLYLDDQNQKIPLERGFCPQPNALAGRPRPCIPKNSLPRNRANPSWWNWRNRARPSPWANKKACWKRWSARASMRPIYAGAGLAGNAKPACWRMTAHSSTTITGWKMMNAVSRFEGTRLVLDR